VEGSSSAASPGGSNARFGTLLVSNMIAPGITTIKSEEPTDFTASLNGFNARYLPTTNDHLFSKFEMTLNGGRLVLVTRPPMVFEGTMSAAEEGVAAFHFEDDRVHKINGTSADRDVWAVWKNGIDYRGIQASRLTHCWLFVPDAFSGHEWPEPSPANNLARLRSNDSSSIRSAVSDALAIAQNDPARLAHPNALKGLSESIIGGLDHALLTAVPPTDRLAVGRYVAICKRAEEYMRESRFSIHSNMEIAKACGVSIRTLDNAFASVLGISLKKYSLLRRLWSVRNALLRAPPHDLVKTIALDHGFWHLGRFSRLYYARFGEFPSASLARC
jgi:AraC family transcriptional regulator, ethanolamine operon transcriptional activator